LLPSAGWPPLISRLRRTGKARSIHRKLRAIAYFAVGFLELFDKIDIFYDCVRFKSWAWDCYV
jgi:hypothetical protein